LQNIHTVLKCFNIAVPCVQAAYNNSSEVDLDNHNTEVEVPAPLGEFSNHTKVAKLFDDVWFEGTVRKYDAHDDLYWVLYSDGDSEELDPTEVRQAKQDYKEYMQPVAAVNSDAVDRDNSTESTVALVAQVVDTATAGCTLPSEMATLIASLAAAADRLAAAADHLTVQSSQSHQHQQQQLHLQQQTYMLQCQQQLRLQQQHMQSTLQQQHLGRITQQQFFLGVMQQQQQQQVLQQPYQRRWYLQ
jgi:hypothetical protein